MNDDTPNTSGVKPNIVEWFDRHWMLARDQALRQGWDSLSRPEQVLVAVGFLLDSCIGDGVWAIVDGVVTGDDEGLTVRMPDALEEVGLAEAAGHTREIIRLRLPAGSPQEDAANRKAAIDHWVAIYHLFDEWVPEGERVMLTRLYEWYHSQGGVSAESDENRHTYMAFTTALSEEYYEVIAPLIDFAIPHDGYMVFAKMFGKNEITPEKLHAAQVSGPQLAQLCDIARERHESHGISVDDIREVLCRVLLRWPPGSTRPTAVDG